MYMDERNDNFDDQVFYRDGFLEYKENIWWLTGSPPKFEKEVDIENSLIALNKGLLTLRDEVSNIRQQLFELYEIIRPKENSIEVLSDLLEKLEVNTPRADDGSTS